MPLTDNGRSKNLFVQPNIQANSQRTLQDTQREGVPIFASKKKKKLDEMGHQHLLLDEMGLDEMGLDEMGINR